ncbi:MAG: glycosyltransferase [Pirellulales bacterium]
MATILLNWELGAGLGHLVNLWPLAKGLCERGHRVVSALRDLSYVERVFAGLDVRCLQAPLRSGRLANHVAMPRSFMHVLHNNGFGNLDELTRLATAWRSLFDEVQPDLMVFDHSPTALLAARAHPARKALIGTGFFCPPDQCPLPDLRPWLGDVTERLRQEEDLVRTHANRVLASWGIAPLERIAQLYHEVDENFLVTFAELDHYGARSNVRYWGAWSLDGGEAPVWPPGNGKRIFGYLRPFAALPQLLAALRHLRCPIILHMPGLNADLRQRFQSQNMRFVTERQNMALVSKQCDLAVLNGNHGTTVSLLLAGKPMLQIPTQLEQGLFSMAVERLGAGLSAFPNRPDQVADHLLRLLRSDEYAHGAARFAARYADYVPERQIGLMLDRVEELLA